MKIAIDIDGTLNNNIPYINKKIKKFAKREGLKLIYNSKAYDFCEKYGYSKNDDNKFWEEEIWNYASEIDEKKGASKFVKKLKEEGNEIVIVTARYLADRGDAIGQRMRDAVEKWLKDKNIIYDDIFYVGKNNSKLQTFLEQKCDILIDDKVQHLQEISQTNFAICMIEDYNKYEDYNSNVYKCKNWKQVYHVIKKINKENHESLSNH